MILHALREYYHRKAAVEEPLSPKGFEPKGIPFVIVINHDGEFVNLQDTREKRGKKLEPQVFSVPKSVGRSGGKAYETAFLLWDHFGYVLSQPKLDKPDAEPKQKEIEMAQKQHHSFKKKLDEFIQYLPDDSGLLAVQQFLSRPDQIERVKSSEVYQDCLKIKGCNLTFRLSGDTHLVCQSPAVIQKIKELAETTNEGEEGVCLVTGEKAPISRLHDNISGVAAKPAPFASINSGAMSAADSYGKTQGFNFPVSEEAVFEYTTALNHLLRRESPNKFRIGEEVFVCWSEKGSDVEQAMPFVIQGTPKDSPDEEVQKIRDLLASVQNGAYQESSDGQRFYLLGLEPNSARVSVKNWQVSTVSEAGANIAQYFDDLAIDGMERSTELSLYRILSNIAVQGKPENIPPNLIAETTRSILINTPFPPSLLNLTLNRIKADQRIDRVRAATIKAYLNRHARKFKNTKEVSMSLDKQDTRTGYRLGRLFAVLEKIQQDASGGHLNSTIRDRYFASASSSPASVFATLMKLSNHHLAKLEKSKIWYEKLIGEIMAEIQGFPSHLDLNAQGLFSIGYYHQKEDFYKKHKVEESEGEEA